VAIALQGSRVLVAPSQGGLYRGVADPPSVPRLVVALAAGAVLGVVLALRGGAARPLLVLLASALPVVPLVLGGGLLLLAFQGRVMVLLASAALGACLGAVLPGLSGLLRSGVPAARTPALILVSVVFFGALGLRIPGPAGPQGDEPHYLLATESLLHDHTLDLTAAFKRKAYADFYPGTLELHASPASPPGRLYSVHAPGLSVLVLPAYALLGYPGARLLMGLLAGLACGAVHRLVGEATGRWGLATLAWAVMTFLPPLPFYAVAIYPEVFACLATALFLLASRSGRSTRLAVLAVIAAAALPWLHPKFLPLAVLGIALALFPPAPRSLRIGGVGLLVVSVGLLLAFFHAYYGRATLSAAYGPLFRSDVQLAHIPRGLLGLLLDRQFGLVFYAPILFLAAPGVPRLLGERPAEAWRATSLAGVSVLTGASFSMWWGGACPPCRFWIPALPCLVLAACTLLPERTRLGGGLFGYGLFLVALAAEAPRAIHNRGDGESGLLRVLAPALDLSGGFPTFVRDGGPGFLLGIALLLALACLWRWGWKGGLVGALAYTALAGAVHPGPLLDAREATLGVLEAYGTLTPAPDLPRFSVDMDLPGAPWTLGPGESLSSRRLDLPPGVYAVRLQGEPLDAAAGVRTTRLTLVADGLELYRRYLRAGEGPEEGRLLLPAGARRLEAVGRGAEGRGIVRGVALSPRALVPASRRSEFRWPRVPAEDRYRVGAGDALVTALDRSLPGPSGFTLQGPEGDFLAEAPRNEAVTLTVRRPHPEPADRIASGSWVGSLQQGTTSLTLPMDQGVELDGTLVLPLRVLSYGASITWSGSPGGTRATSPTDRSPPFLPTVTTMSPPPESGKE
jgi:hypothetical protein